MAREDQHASVLLTEAIDSLAIRPDGLYVDGTFGRGGHSRAILARLGAAGQLIAIDRDLQAVEAARSMADRRLRMVHGRFGELTALLAACGADRVDGILLDLGVSSPQLDDEERGMSFRFDAPLDMRMDRTQGETAAQWLLRASEKEIEEVIKKYGEERFAHAIAKALVAARTGGHPVVTTRQLATLVEKVVRTREPGQHPATRCFQALRIHINRELEELSLVLPQAVSHLRPQGRLVVISFHSLEDRIVKRFLRDEARPDVLPARLPVRAAELPPARLRLLGRARRPSPAEVAANPRARSAVMRVAERLDDGRAVGAPVGVL